MNHEQKCEKTWLERIHGILFLNIAKHMFPLQRRQKLKTFVLRPQYYSKQVLHQFETCIFVIGKNNENKMHSGQLCIAHKYRKKWW